MAAVSPFACSGADDDINMRMSWGSILAKIHKALAALLMNRRIWLALLLLWVVNYQARIAYQVIDDLRHGESKPGLPLTFGFQTQAVSGTTSEAYEAGVRDGDVLETVNGHPFNCMRVLYEAVNRGKPGDSLFVTVRSAKGTDFGVSIQIPALALEQPTVFEWLGQLAVVVGLPLFCLSLGFWVAFRRPKDRLSWLFLAMTIGFSGLALEFPIAELPNQFVMFVWWALLASPFGLWSTWIVLFALLFPAPARLDQRLPWLRCIWIIPPLVLTAGMTALEMARETSFKQIEFLPLLIQRIPQTRSDLLIPLCAVLFFLLVISLKSVFGQTVDGRRRLRILLLGSLLSLGPVLAQSARAIRNGSDLLQWAGPLEYFATLVPLLLFPVTLSYVISIRRALDVRVTIRRGVQYALIEGGLNISQLLVTAGVIGIIALLGTGKDVSLENRIEIIVFGVVAIVAVRSSAQRLAKWIDRIFFRAACNDEQALRELASSLRTLMDENTLMETLTRKISAALHVPRVAFLLNGGGEFKPACATGYSTEPPFSLPESGGIVRYLKAAQTASPIYFDDKKNWIQTINPIDQEPLKQERTELLLPIAVKAKLLGIVALGPKRAEAPYTARDLQLLDVVAAQASFALENSRLAAQWALENAASEKQLR